MLSYLILIILIIGLIINKTKFVLLTFAISPILYSINIGGFSIWEYMNLIIFISYTTTILTSFKQIIKNPLLFPVIVICLSYILSNYYSEIKHNGSTIINVISFFNYLFIYIEIMKLRHKQINFICKTTLIIAIIVIINTIIETITHVNPILSFLIETNLYSSDVKIIDEIRFGIKRAQSLFTMHTSLAGYCIIIFSFLSYIKQKKYINISVPAHVLILLTICIFLTGVRSAIIGYIIAVFTFVNKDFFNKKNLPIILLMILIILIGGIDYIITIYDSIVNSDKVHGSSSDMRLIQFIIGLSYLEQSPWLGNGIAYTWEIARVEHEQLYGAESIWLPYMIDQGMLGCISIMLLYIYVYKILHYNKMNNVGFILLGFLVFNTMSSIPGIEFTFLMFYLFIIIRMKQLYKI